MNAPKLNSLFKVADFLLWPVMFILGGFKFPVQETHLWHMKKWNWKDKGLKIDGRDDTAIFGHGSLLGHAPVFGGLTKYVVVEASGFNSYWNVGWKNVIQLLPLKQTRIKLLVGKNGTLAHGLGDSSKHLKLKIIGYGKLGDNKYKNIRLF